MKISSIFNNRTYILCGIFLIAFQGLLLFHFGQPPICTCSHITLWTGQVLGPENSQQIFDWYTFSHIIHGFLFYLLLWALFPKMPILGRLTLAIGIESAWEIAENTPYIINLYRQTALAQGYSGDSIINSLFDTLSMCVGFFLARRLPLWLTISLGVGMELFVGYMIRDNLTLNIINFIYQFDAIKIWQSGGEHVPNAFFEGA